MCLFFFFFVYDTATTEVYTLSLHDALPISQGNVDLDSKYFPAVGDWARIRLEAEATGPNTAIANIYYTGADGVEHQALGAVAIPTFNGCGTLNCNPQLPVGSRMYLDDVSIIIGSAYLSADFNKDHKVDFEDFGVFSSAWLKCTDPDNPNCY